MLKRISRVLGADGVAIFLRSHGISCWTESENLADVIYTRASVRRINKILRQNNIFTISPNQVHYIRED